MKYFFTTPAVAQPEWQAQPPAQPAVAGALSAGLLALDADALLPLKSVAYHPVPFSWKPAADTIFV